MELEICAKYRKETNIGYISLIPNISLRNWSMETWAAMNELNMEQNQEYLYRY